MAFTLRSIAVRVAPLRQARMAAAPVRGGLAPVRSMATKVPEVADYAVAEKGPKDSLEYRIQFQQNGKTISCWHEIPLHAGDGLLHFICEIPKETSAKMEVATDEPGTPIKQDTKKGKLRFYPYNINWNYGMLPQTWEDPAHKAQELGGIAGDNDPVDVVEIGSSQLKMGGVYKLAMADDSSEPPEASEEQAARATAAGTGADPGAAAAPAAAPTHAADALPHGWACAWDERFGAYYYCNPELGITQWEPPAAAAPPGTPSTTGHGSGSGGADSATAATAAAASPGTPPSPRYSYRDPHGCDCGPFSLAQLLSWRDHLPMDLRLQRADSSRPARPADGGCQADEPPAAAAAAAAAAARGELEDSGTGGPVPARAEQQRSERGCGTSEEGQQQEQQQEQQEEEGPPEPQARSDGEQEAAPLLLADLLGDGELLGSWRAAAAQWPQLAPPPGPGEGGAAAPRAPPAPAFEAWWCQQHEHQHQHQQQQQHQEWYAAGHGPAVPQPDFGGCGYYPGSNQAAAPAAPAAPGDPEPGRGGGGAGGSGAGSSFAEYAEAVLAGLPPTDEAVILAKTAAHYGRPLEAVMAAAAASAPGSGPGGAGPGALEFARDPRSGRLTAVYDGAGPPAAARLYGDLDRWADPRQLEAALAARRARGGAGPAPEGGWQRYNAARKKAKLSAGS
ncbi:inorganic pyrophosphatase [Raphidocelis subcapitata]|uniref:inorganic diphosphatase n=1 Tax=Raphidocelis subcapitata TaxID=307507 RepID=A0A2V0P985_9CHLO|nr:inorganic pyrophosphatase [Raphidocelis subcapitata]|eukprot:GBF93727.1 inorganic pyrophosphatase [Raphidocelis subcapitata]